MISHDLKNIPEKEIMPGFFGRFIHTEEMTFAYWNIKAGSVLPEHAHLQVQVANMLEGEFELTVNGHTRRLTEGMPVVIPSNAVHSGMAITDCKILDVFNPARDDYR